MQQVEQLCFEMFSDASSVVLIRSKMLLLLLLLIFCPNGTVSRNFYFCLSQTGLSSCMITRLQLHCHAVRFRFPVVFYYKVPKKSALAPLRSFLAVQFSLDRQAGLRNQSRSSHIFQI